MTWATITGAGTSTAVKFFGDVMNKINNMFNGVDITDTVTIHTNVTWSFQDNSFKLRDSNDSNAYSIRGGNLTVDVDALLPVLSGNDTFGFIGLAQTVSAVKTHTEDIFFNTQTKGIVNIDTQTEPQKHQYTTDNAGNIEVKIIA